jgi:3-methyladenine DNA glycosylase AlkD
MAWLAVHDKRAPDENFLAFLPLIERAAGDDRNFVKKAVNWALRQIGKRNAALQSAAIECARRIHAQGTPSARWIASDALRELTPRTIPRKRVSTRT